MKGELHCKKCEAQVQFSDSGRKLFCNTCGGEWVRDEKGVYRPAQGSPELIIAEDSRSLVTRWIIGFIGIFVSLGSLTFFSYQAEKAPGNTFLPLLYLSIPFIATAIVCYFGFRKQRVQSAGEVVIPDEDILALRTTTETPSMLMASEAPGKPDDNIRKIQELADLHRQGILSDEEFQAKKEELLGRI